MDTGRAMSQENVAVARAFLEAYNRGDFEAALKHAAPGFVLDFSRALGPYRGVYRRNETRRFLEELNATFRSVRFKALDFIESGDHLVVPLTIQFEGRDGIKVKADTTNLWTFRDGAVERIVLYQELQEALEAVGLPE
jgi:ketosteroid isomerase-like protein